MPLNHVLKAREGIQTHHTPQTGPVKWTVTPLAQKLIPSGSACHTLIMRYLALCAGLVLVGCVSQLSKPEPKATGIRLADFSGEYTNRVGSREVTAAITPYSSGAWDADTIKVSVEGKFVSIEARRDGRAIYSRTFEEGKDFRLRNSQIKTQTATSGRVVHADEGFIFPAIPGPEGRIFFGTFFLNKNRDLVYCAGDVGFQLSFYFLPTTGGSKEDIVFKRLSP
jgi:hypothetical protein